MLAKNVAYRKWCCKQLITLRFLSLIHSGAVSVKYTRSNIA